MRVIRFADFGGPEVLRVEEAPRPEPGDGELLVEVDVVGVTLSMVRLTRSGVDLPHVPGGDVVGHVVTPGPGLTGCRPPATRPTLVASGLTETAFQPAPGLARENSDRRR